MLVSLKKNQSIKISLTKSSDPDILCLPSQINVGLGWDPAQTERSIDLDAFCIELTNEPAKKQNVVFFNNELNQSRSIQHLGDSLTGEESDGGDDEIIRIDLSSVPLDVRALLIGVHIYSGLAKRQNFAMINNTFIRLCDTTGRIEYLKYAGKFKQDFGNCTCVLFAVLVRQKDGWMFKALSSGLIIKNITDLLPILNQRFNRNPDFGPITGDLQTMLINNFTILPVEQKEEKFMAISLSKGGRISLDKVASDAGIASLTQINVGLGWDTNRYDGAADFDLDASAFLLGDAGKVRQQTDFVFYGHLEEKGVKHTGDNRTGDTAGDDEVIIVNLPEVDPNVQKIVFTVTIYEAENRNQNFGMVENAYVHLTDSVSGKELLRYDLGEDFSLETAIVVCELYRKNGGWNFNAVGSGFARGLAALCENFGIDVA